MKFRLAPIAIAAAVLGTSVPATAITGGQTLCFGETADVVGTSRADVIDVYDTKIVISSGGRPGNAIAVPRACG